MKKAEAFNGISDRLKLFFLERGFELQKNPYSVFYKKTEYGYERFFLTILDYNPTQKIEFGWASSHSIVEEITAGINTKFNLIKLPDLCDTLLWQYPHSTGTSLNKCFVKEEGDFDKCLSFIHSYLDNQGLNFFTLFSDLREVDKVINGKEFWTTDWRMSYSFRVLFGHKRTIIAYLCSNPRLELIKQFHINQWREGLSKYPDFQNYLDSYDYLFEVLKEIKPLD